MIGITEHGDSSICLEWIDKIDTVDELILVTKNPGAFIKSDLAEIIKEHKDKITFHCSISGYGKTMLEQRVSPILTTILCMKELKDSGFKVALKIYPIIATPKGFNNLKALIDNVRNMLGSLKDLEIHWDFLNNTKDMKARGIKVPWTTKKTPEVYDDEFAGANLVISYFNWLEENDNVILKYKGKGKTYKILPKHWIDKTNNYIELLDDKEQCFYRCLHCPWDDAPEEEIEETN